VAVFRIPFSVECSTSISGSVAVLELMKALNVSRPYLIYPSDDTRNAFPLTAVIKTVCNAIVHGKFGARRSMVVKAICYKPEGRGFEPLIR
jgi:hypothetical protein